MGGGGATASAEHRDPFRNIRLVHGGEILRAYRIVHRAVREPRVRLDEEGDAAHRRKAPHEREDAVRSEGAVDADKVRQGGSGDAEALHAAPREGAPALVESHGTHDGKGAVLARGEERRSELRKVGHGLYDDDVRALPCQHLLLENVVRLLKGKVAERLGERARGPYVEGDEPVIARRFPRELYARRGEPPRLARRGMLAAVGAEGVGGDDVRAAFDIGAVQREHLFGRGEIELLRRSARGQPRALELRAEAAVQEDEASFCKREKVLFHRLSSLLRTPMTAVTVFCGVMSISAPIKTPSRLPMSSKRMKSSC